MKTYRLITLQRYEECDDIDVVQFALINVRKKELVLVCPDGRSTRESFDYIVSTAILRKYNISKTHIEYSLYDGNVVVNQWQDYTHHNVTYVVYDQTYGYPFESSFEIQDIDYIINGYRKAYLLNNPDAKLRVKSKRVLNGLYGLA